MKTSWGKRSLIRENGSKLSKIPDSILERRVEKKFGLPYHTGTVFQHDIDESTNEVIWTILYDDGDREDLNDREILRVLIDDNDFLEAALKYLRAPDHLLGKQFNKIFPDGNNYQGTIKEWDTDKSNNETIWRVVFKDGDAEDYNITDLLAGLKK